MDRKHPESFEFRYSIKLDSSMCSGMCEVISMQIMPAGEMTADLCFADTAGGTSFKGLRCPYNVHRVHWSLCNKFLMNVCYKSSAASASLSILSYLKAVVQVRLCF